ncbi:protein turtle homolog B [Penaeus vannamei]|uniref:protein turtle homolog B n=1 Tax=Penaeus vannamei TaxID=6689 RepID=UPI00387FAB51
MTLPIRSPLDETIPGGRSPLDELGRAPLVAVYAVRGQTARLPCNLTAPPEDPVILVLWYKNGTKTPVFSVDSRSRALQEGSNTRASDLFRGRATFQQQPWSWVLVVQQVEYSDQGEYRCRLDFQSSPTHNGRVQLHVVDLPRKLRIFTSGGAQVEGLVSVQESHPLTLSCRATGGEPLPNVTWWSGSNSLDLEVEERQLTSSLTAAPTSLSAPYVTNTLHLPAVTHAHLTQNLTCRAANTPVLPPLSATVMLKQIDSNLSVHMTAPTGKLSGGREYDVKCEASGVRPPPTLTWWLRGQHLTHNIDVQSLGVDSTVSLLRLLATAGDDNGLLECRATAPTLPHVTASASAKLTVHYVPEATISIDGVGGLASGGTGAAGFRAGDSATLKCTARANPPAYNQTFMFNGRPLRRESVVKSGLTESSITLLQLTHKDAGLYTCLASNPEGDGQSNAVALHIDYAPVCEWEGAREILAAVGEEVEMECRVRASPPQVSYEWESITVAEGREMIREPLRHVDNGLTSRGAVVAGNSSHGRQRAECQPSNEVGPADRPCVFAITLVEPPGALEGCHYHDVTTDSATVTCSPGSSMSVLPQLYHIEVREGNRLVSAHNKSEPRFVLTELSPEQDYVLTMYASHAKGRGEERTLLLKTHTPKPQQVLPKDVSVNSVNKVSEVAPTVAAGGGGGPQVSVVVAGVVGVVVGVAIVVAVVVTCRARRGHTSSPGKSEQYHHSKDSLLELPQGSMYQTCTRHPSRELLTTFSPGPVVVTQVTSGRSSIRSSPLPRRSSTRSAPGGTSPRGHRPRSRSGGPVNVVEVEADTCMAPRVEIESPSRESICGRLSLRGDPYTIHDSPPLALRPDPLTLSVQHQHANPQSPNEAKNPTAHSMAHAYRTSPHPHAAGQLHPEPQIHIVSQHPHTTLDLAPQPHGVPELAATQPREALPARALNPAAQGHPAHFAATLPPPQGMFVPPPHVEPPFAHHQPPQASRDSQTLPPQPQTEAPTIHQQCSSPETGLIKIHPTFR